MNFQRAQERKVGTIIEKQRKLRSVLPNEKINLTCGYSPLSYARRRPRNINGFAWLYFPCPNLRFENITWFYIFSIKVWKVETWNRTRRNVNEPYSGLRSFIIYSDKITLILILSSSLLCSSSPSPSPYLKKSHNMILFHPCMTEPSIFK